MVTLSQKNPVRIAVAVAVAIAVAGCASEGTKPAEPKAQPTPAAAQPAPVDVRPVAAPAVPDVPPAEARPMAAKLALQAVDQLQVGDEASARATIEQALKLDPANDLAKKLLDQINADAQRELGAVYFRYTVQPADTLSKLAQQYMGDRFRFWILAKYNDIGNPSRLGAGQVIKIPGRQPVTPPPPVVEPATRVEPAAPAPAPEPKPELADAMKRGADLEKAGNLEAAYATYVDAAARFPASADAAKKRDAAKVALIRQLDREASQAFQRQNLDLAITKWDRVLELDANNKNARLKREQALDLKKRMADKFGGKK
ncbi:MAG: LysM peptidoglycan-binding domain-containing protein [Burkholderiales bacterium]|jgi:tetratricopeptide (TPR) repeat protein|nr:LysM peptidoglycan-binding domain-containing protein [Burkholderiales bacterium]